MAVVILGSEDEHIEPGEFLLISMDEWDSFREALKEAGLYESFKENANFSTYKIRVSPGHEE